MLRSLTFPEAPACRAGEDILALRKSPPYGFCVPSGPSPPAGHPADAPVVCVLKAEDGGCAVCGTGGGGHVGEGSGWEQLIVIPFILSLVSVGESAGSSGAIWSKTTLKVFL